MRKFTLITAVLSILAPVSAETIRMRDGSYHSGEVTSADADQVHVKFAENGLEIDLKWDQLAPGEAQRLKARFASEAAAKFKEDGEVVYTRNETIEGIVKEEKPDKLRLKTAKGEKEILVSAILRREKTKINALSVYTPEELYARKSAEYKLDTVAGNFDLGDLCLALNLFAKAREHFSKALELDSSWKSRIDPRLAKADAGIKEAEAAAMLKEADDLTKADKLEDAVAKYKEIVEKYPGTEAAAKAAEKANKGESDVTQLKGEQKKEADKKLAKAYYDEMKSQVGKAIAKKALTFDDLKGYVDKADGLVKDILDALATKLKADRKQLEMDWKARELDEWKTASYGEGSWLMNPPDLAIEKGNSQDDIKNKREKADLIAQLKAAAGEQRKSAADWWAKQTATVKNNWLMAYAAEKTMIIKPPDITSTKCNKCAGKGIIGASTLCGRCLGTGVDRVISYK